MANGGGITLTELDANVRAGRRMILIEGSGRAADALISLLKATKPSDPEVTTLRTRAEQATLTRQPELFRVVALDTGAEGLRDALVSALSRAQ